MTATVESGPASLASDDRTEWWIYLAATGAGLVALGAWAWRRGGALYDARQARWQASEAKAFRELQQACRSGDVHVIYRCLVAWRARTTRPGGLAPFLMEIESVLFVGTPWSPARARAFGGRLRTERCRLNASSAVHALPPLNPVAKAD